MTADTTTRPARPGERCTCGRPATTVYNTAAHGPVGWCGITDGGAEDRQCVFCGGPRHTIDTCPDYQLRP